MFRSQIDHYQGGTIFFFNFSYYGTTEHIISKSVSFSPSSGEREGGGHRQFGCTQFEPPSDKSDRIGFFSVDFSTDLWISWLRTPVTIRGHTEAPIFALSFFFYRRIRGVCLVVLPLNSAALLLESILLVFTKTPLNSFHFDMGDISHWEDEDGYILHRLATKPDPGCKCRRSGMISCQSLNGFIKAQLHGRKILIQETYHLLMISGTAWSSNSSYSYAQLLDRWKYAWTQNMPEHKICLNTKYDWTQNMTEHKISLNTKYAWTQKPRYNVFISRPTSSSHPIKKQNLPLSPVWDR